MKRSNLLIVALLVVFIVLLVMLIIPKSKDEACMVVSPTMGDLETEQQLDNIIDGGYIKNTSQYFLKSRDDFRYLPYYVQMFNDCYLTKRKARLFKDIYGIMSHKLDTGLVKLYNHILESEHSKNRNLEIDGHKYDFQFKSGLHYSIQKKIL